MGGLIPLACYQALSGTFDLRALLWAVPTILGVGLIMFTNNTCDVEKDVESGTPHAVGAAGTRAGAQAVSRVVYAWVAAIVVLVAAFFTNGLLVMPFMLLASYPLLKALLGNPLAPQARIGAWRRCVARTSHWARSTRRPSWQAASRSRSSGRNGIPWKRPSRRGCSDSGRSTSLEARRRELPKHRARTTHRARDPSAFGTSRVTWWSEGPCMPYTSKDVKTTRRETRPGLRLRCGNGDGRRLRGTKENADGDRSFGSRRVAAGRVRAADSAAVQRALAGSSSPSPEKTKKGTFFPEGTANTGKRAHG